MTPDEMAEVRPRLLDFTAEMLGGLPRKDQRAAGELYVRGLLTDGQRKSMVPMAERLGADHQRLQQFITSSTWDYAAVRRNVARWFAAGQPVEALVVDDTGFPKDGDASPCVARQYSGTLGKTAGRSGGRGRGAAAPRAGRPPGRRPVASGIKRRPALSRSSWFPPPWKPQRSGGRRGPSARRTPAGPRPPRPSAAATADEARRS